MSLVAKTLCMGVAISLMASIAFAQSAPLAPTGSHYAGRTTDTGFASVSNMGGYSATIPFDFPEARGGTSIPISINYGGRRVGMAGVGWDMPMSFVRLDASLAQRRPAFGSGAPVGREQVMLSIAGTTTAMVRSNVNADVWVAREDAPALQLTRESENRWVLRDGNGREFVFDKFLGSANNDMWLLSLVSSSEGKIKLDWVVSYRTFPDDNRFFCTTGRGLDCAGGTGAEIDLASVKYNDHPSTTDCWKNEITFEYGPTRNEPLSITFLDSLAVVRSRTVRYLNVLGRSVCGTSTSPKTIRRYEFEYDNEPDTNNPRLRAVWMTGTSTSSGRIPVGKYEYGSATTGGALQFVPAPSISLPADALVSGGTPLASTEFAPSTHDGTSWRNLIDVTGDARPDLIFKKNNQLWVAVNRPSVGGGTVFATPVQLSDSVFTGRALASDQDYTVQYDPNNSRYRNDTWRRLIDINGDGRIDVIDAREEANKWTIYLNTPGVPVTWVKRTVDVEIVRMKLGNSGHVIDGDYVPLARRSTGIDMRLTECWKWSPHFWSLLPPVNCLPWSFEYPPVQTPVSGEKTITEWDLLDLNSDGYTDFVYSDSPASHFFLPTPLEPHEQGYDSTFLRAFNLTRVFEQKTGGLKAMFNTAGVRIDALGLFATPLQVLGDTRCGVSMWQDIDGKQVQQCGIEDVNGDGLADRIEHGVDVWLGSGAGLATTGVVMRLPGPFQATNPRAESCDGDGFLDQNEFTVFRTGGLIDLTGDGIPDYVGSARLDLNNDGQPEDLGGLWIGTGVGFRYPVPFSASLSSTLETCAGAFSKTTGGLYDLDGDGRPENVFLNATTNMWDVRRVAGTPIAGLLTATENGYGARTTIEYRSAKEDVTTKHDVPFPEIVVSSVETNGQLGLGGSLHRVRYAFGDAEQFFDPALDAFTIRAYARSVAVYGVGRESGSAAFAVIEDRHKLAPFTPPPGPVVPDVESARRFDRYQLVGRLAASHTLGNDPSADPWTLLSSNPLSSSRLLGGEYSDWQSRLVPTIGIPGNRPTDCADIMYPYNWTASWSENLAGGNYSCQWRGFTYVRSTSEWTGTAPPTTNFNNVETRLEVLSVDDFGRNLTVRSYNDTARSDDDVCIETRYASPTGPRVLTAIASKRVTDCGLDQDLGRTLSLETFEYDGLPQSSVGVGNLTSRLVERRSTYDGSLLATTREFAASYDSFGNVEYVAFVRDDGALRTVKLKYDPFRIAAIDTLVEGTGVAPQATRIEREPITLDVIETTDPTGTRWIRKLDELGREISRSVSVTSGSSGIVSKTTYSGFAQGESGRRVISTIEYPNPGSATGQETTVMLDELGRQRRVERALGTSYIDKALVEIRTYDELGRTRFESDPYPISQEGTPVYGTTYHHGSDGRLLCAIRGNGAQPLITVSDLAQEIFPTCFAYQFANHEMKIWSVAPDSSIASTQQTGVYRTDTVTAIGRMLSRETTKNGTRLELSRQTYNRLGQVTGLTRFNDPVNAAQPATWEWRYDSLGQVLTQAEPNTALKTFHHNSSGEAISTEWTDAGIPRQIRQTFDALGRLVASAQLEGGSVLPDTNHKWIYDVADSASPIGSKFALGRLTGTKSPIGDMHVSYNAFGRVDHRAFVSPMGEKYFESTNWAFDGLPLETQHKLPDAAYVAERYEYQYDSARRLTGVKEIGKGMLYQARSIDALGRVLKAEYGGSSTFQAFESYATTGRRLQKSMELKLASSSRSIQYDSYDAAGRELVRRETSDGVQQTFTSGYDALGQLGTERLQIPGQNLQFRSFVYDPLGNITELSNSVGGSAYLTYDATDRDRICRISYGSPSAGACNVTYDGVGNIKSQPTRTGTRTLVYLPSGDVSRIVEGSVQADLRYDGSGEITEVSASGPNDPRRDRRFGPFTVREIAGRPVITRELGGATRRGKDSAFVFPFGEMRGLRFGVNHKGILVQSTEYQPYGEARSTGTLPNTTDYTNEQWNGGDLLADLGVVRLGARLYDPVIGRFTSRDPLLLSGTASSTNPYAFGLNDPRNFSDPSGMCGEPEQLPCPQDPIGPGGGGGDEEGNDAPHFPDLDPVLAEAPTGAIPGTTLSDQAKSSRTGPTDTNWVSIDDLVFAGACRDAGGGPGCGAGSRTTDPLGRPNKMGVASRAPVPVQQQDDRNWFQKYVFDYTSPWEWGVAIVTGPGLKILGKLVSKGGKVLKGALKATAKTAPKILNRAKKVYPKINNPATKQAIHFPGQGLKEVPEHLRTKWDGSMDRYNFIKEWHDRGLPTPRLGWDKMEIHHIRPLQYGGTNAFDNLVPLTHKQHLKFTKWWKKY